MENEVSFNYRVEDYIIVGLVLAFLFMIIVNAVILLIHKLVSESRTKSETIIQIFNQQNNTQINNINNSAVPVIAETENVKQDNKILLTEREKDIANLLVNGLSNIEIAAELHISPETVKNQISPLMKKVGARNRAHAVSKIIQEKILD